MVLTTIVLARWSSLEAAGEFSVIAAVGAVAFMVSNWGLRPLAAMDRLETFPPSSFVAVRVISLAAGALATIAVARILEVPLDLTAIVILLRAGDAVLDLAFGFLQARWHADQVIVGHAIQQGTRLGAFALGLLIGVLVVESTATVLIIAAAVSVIGGLLPGVREIARSMAAHRGGHTRSNLTELLTKATPFAVAALASSLLTSSPRIVNGTIHDGAILGVIGTSLSLATFLGMPFVTTWTRWIGRFASEGPTGSTIRGFIAESTMVALLALLAAVIVLPTVAQLAFGYETQEHVKLARRIFVAAVPFQFAIGAANIFKATRWPLCESIVYVVGTGALAATPFVLAGPSSIAAGMIVAGLIMAMFITGLLRPARQIVGRVPTVPTRGDG